MFAAVLWTLFAVYGIGIQAFNLKWAIYKWQLIHRLPNRTAEQEVTVLSHARLNIVRTFVVVVNLAIGVTSMIVKYQQAQTGSTPPPTIYGLFFTIGFLANEFGWDIAVTLEVLGRRKLRKLS
jgi:hypothetical protein